MKILNKAVKGVCVQCKIARAAQRVPHMTYHRRDNGGEIYAKATSLALCAECAAVMQGRTRTRCDHE